MIELERTRNGNEILRDTFALFATAWRAYLLIGFVVVAPVYIAIFGLGLGDITARFDGSPDNGRTFLEGGVLIAIVLPLVMTMVAHTLAPESSTGGAIQAGLERFTPALVVAVLAMAAAVVGLFAFIVPGIYLTIRLAVAVPACAIERLGPVDALRRSWVLTTGQGVRVLLAMLIVLLLTALLEAVVEVPVFAIAKAVDSQGVVLVGEIIAYAVSLPIATIATALVFFDLRARQLP